MLDELAAQPPTDVLVLQRRRDRVTQLKAVVMTPISGRSGDGIDVRYLRRRHQVQVIALQRGHHALQHGRILSAGKQPHARALQVGGGVDRAGPRGRLGEGDQGFDPGTGRTGSGSMQLLSAMSTLFCAQ
ncbi:hypothetical protein [Massilia sp. TWR1-2-2]|uniref:hypothetical protein n=1 Tax=Massilia sp. TWR1-2-2 TaxID=2804584 RepID=UPI003CF3EA4C